MPHGFNSIELERIGRALADGATEAQRTHRPSHIPRAQRLAEKTIQNLEETGFEIIRSGNNG
jgi:hypothetical protein